MRSSKGGTLSLATLMAMMVLIPAISTATETAGQRPAGAHTELTGVVTKIESGMVFVQTEGVQSRTISINKAERTGLHDIKVGDTVALVLDENNVLVDVHKARSQGRLLTGKFHSVDASGNQMKLATPKGVEKFDVDSLASRKLRKFAEGQAIVIEVNDANVVIDVHPVQ
jgi:ribosomal protein S1